MIYDINMIVQYDINRISIWIIYMFDYSNFDRNELKNRSKHRNTGCLKKTNSGMGISKKYQIWMRSETLIMSDSLKNHRNVISESVNFFHLNFEPSSSSIIIIIIFFFFIIIWQHHLSYFSQTAISNSALSGWCSLASTDRFYDCLTWLVHRIADFWDRNSGVDPRVLGKQVWQFIDGDIDPIYFIGLVLLGKSSPVKPWFLPWRSWGFPVNCPVNQANEYSKIGHECCLILCCLSDYYMFFHDSKVFHYHVSLQGWGIYMPPTSHDQLATQLGRCCL